MAKQTFLNILNPNLKDLYNVGDILEVENDIYIYSNNELIGIMNEMEVDEVWN